MIMTMSDACEAKNESGGSHGHDELSDCNSTDYTSLF